MAEGQETLSGEMHVHKTTVGERLDNDTPREAPAGGPLGVPHQVSKSVSKEVPTFALEQSGEFAGHSFPLLLLGLADLGLGHSALSSSPGFLPRLHWLLLCLW